MPTLRDITGQFAEILDALDEAGGELSPDVQHRLDGLELLLAVKVDGICRVLAELHAQEVALQAEVDRLRAKLAAKVNGQRRLKEHVKTQLELAGVPKVETPLFTVRVQKNSAPSIEWTGQGYPPPVFQRVIVELDSTAARVYLKDHGELPAGFRVTHGTHLRIQ